MPDEIPRVVANFVRKQFGSSPEGWYMQVWCPFCHEHHWHGGGNGPGDDMVYGYRISHCSGSGPNPSYELVPDPLLGV